MLNSLNTISPADRLARSDTLPFLSMALDGLLAAERAYGKTQFTAAEIEEGMLIHQPAKTREEALLFALAATARAMEMFDTIMEEN